MLIKSETQKELSVLFTEIIIPIIEARSTVTFYQRISLLKFLERLLSDPSSSGGKAWIEIYLNYDCDVDATDRENLWEAFLTALCNSITETYTHGPPLSPGSLANKPVISDMHPQYPMSLTTNSLATFTKEQLKELFSVTGDNQKLKAKSQQLIAY